MSSRRGLDGLEGGPVQPKPPFGDGAVGPALDCDNKFHRAGRIVGCPLFIVCRRWSRKDRFLASPAAGASDRSWP